MPSTAHERARAEGPSIFPEEVNDMLVEFEWDAVRDGEREEASDDHRFRRLIKQLGVGSPVVYVPVKTIEVISE